MKVTIGGFLDQGLGLGLLLIISSCVSLTCDRGGASMEPTIERFLIILKGGQCKMKKSKNPIIVDPSTLFPLL